MHSKENLLRANLYTGIGGGGGRGWWGLLLGILVGAVCPVPQTLTLFQTEKRPFSTPAFRPGL